MTARGFAIGFFVVGLALVLWLLFRNKLNSTAGHATPDDAMAWGWAVYPRGITGWREIGPHGEIVDHDTGGESVARNAGYSFAGVNVADLG